MKILGGKQHAKYLTLENGQSVKMAMCMADDNNENDKGTFTKMLNIQTNRVSLTDRSSDWRTKFSISLNMF